jgi:phage gpG-like protein
MANLKVEVSQAAIEAAINIRLARLQRPRPLYAAWAQYLEGLAGQAFRTETVPFGAAWAPLAPATLASTPRRRGKLRVTGTLFDSTVGQVLADGAAVGSNLAVGSYSLLAIQIFGAPRRNIPARMALPMEPDGEPMPEIIPELTALTLDFLDL